MTPIILAVVEQRNKKFHMQRELACAELHSASRKRQSLNQEVIKGQGAAGRHMGAWTLLWTTA